jgi:hypothetical protein
MSQRVSDGSEPTDDAVMELAADLSDCRARLQAANRVVEAARTWDAAQGEDDEEALELACENLHLAVMAAPREPEQP